MKKFKLNVQRHICILLCFILYITVLPLPVSAEEAKSKFNEAQALKLEYENRLEDADKEAQDIKSKASEQAQSAADPKLKDAEKQKEKIISDAKAAAQRQKEKVLEESKQEIIELAAQMAEKVLKSKN